MHRPHVHLQPPAQPGLLRRRAAEANQEDQWRGDGLVPGCYDSGAYELIWGNHPHFPFSFVGTGGGGLSLYRWTLPFFFLERTEGGVQVRKYATMFSDGSG